MVIVMVMVMVMVIIMVMAKGDDDPGDGVAGDVEVSGGRDSRRLLSRLQSKLLNLGGGAFRKICKNMGVEFFSCPSSSIPTFVIHSFIHSFID